MHERVIGYLAATTVVVLAAMPAVAQRGEGGGRGGANTPQMLPFGAAGPGGGPGTEGSTEEGTGKARAKGTRAGTPRAARAQQGGAPKAEAPRSGGVLGDVVDRGAQGWGAPGFAFGFGGAPWGAPYAAYAGPSCEVARVRRSLPNGRVVWRSAQICY
jgi:hypothetical protein